MSLAADRRQVYLSLMIDGVGSAPFSAVTIPPIEAPPVSYREQVIEASRAQFTAARAGIEKAIIEELAASAASPAPFDARMRKKPVQYTPPIRQSVDVVKPFAHRPPAPDERSAQPIVPRPPVATKSPDDLKTILRSMTAKSGVEKEHKQTQNQQSLKGVLAEVLGKSKQETVNSKQPEPPREKKTV